MRPQRGAVVSGGEVRLEADILDAQRRHLGAPPASGAEGSSRMARSRISAVRFIQQVRSSASIRSPVSARSLLRVGGRARRTDGEAHGRADLSVGEGAVEPAPAVHRAPEGKPPANRRGRMRPGRDKRALEPQRVGDLLRHPWPGSVSLRIGSHR